jgi:hypothetical protein
MLHGVWHSNQHLALCLCRRKSGYNRMTLNVPTKEKKKGTYWDNVSAAYVNCLLALIG